MLSEDTQEKLASILTDRIQKINEKILVKIGENIKKIGSLTTSQAYQIQQILKYGGDLQKIINELAKVTKLNVNDIYKILEEEAKRNQAWAKQFYDYKGIDFIPYEQNIRLQRQVKALANLTAETYLNISNTRAIGYTIKDLQGNVVFKDISSVYRDTIDKAILSVSQGKSTYQEQMREIIKQIGTSGLKTIDYETGTTRRLDSAIKMNLLGGIRDLSNEMQNEFGKEFGADAIEISVHEFPAIDHADIQGHQFSFEEFNKFKDDKEFEDLKGNKFLPTDERGQDRRNISQYNCFHYLFNIVAGVSKPQYTDKQLQEINERNEKGFEFEGKHYTFYDGEQLLNRIALEIRKNKDTQIMAKSSGDDDLILSSQTNITQLTTKYRQVVKISGLPNKLATKGWVPGYKRTSVKNLKK